MAAQPYFTPELFKFLRALGRNNNREWFLANKARYEETLRQPALRFIADMQAPLAQISPQLVASAKPVGGSLFRIHRDTRFANDKTPYKTHLGISFFHAATKAVARGDGGTGAMGRLDGPVIYLHLEPGGSFTGGGIWHPMPETLKRIRDYMVNNPRSWKEATQSAAFRKLFELGGEALSRPPRGYDAAHELIADLKRKDFVASSGVEADTLFDPALPKLLAKRYEKLSPMLDWLCGAVDLDF